MGEEILKFIWKEKKMNKSNDILKETDCLSEQKMRDYLQGKLNRREVYEVETHIASCHFCAEIGRAHV